MSGHNRSYPAASEVVELLRELERIHQLGSDCPPERRQAFLRRKEELLSRIVGTTSDLS